MYRFKTHIELIGINPYVLVPDEILKKIMKVAGREKGPIQICGTINQKPYKQTLVKFRGDWRLYINTSMLKNSPKRIGEQIEIEVAFDPAERIVAMHPKLKVALNKNAPAKQVFESLTPSRKLEINRYLSFLKTEISVDRNILKVMNFLSGKGRFAGRDKP